MENNTNQSDSLFNLSIEGAARELLLTAATWARVIAVVGFITAGLSILSAIVGKAGAGSAQMVGSIFGALIGAAITVVINIFLYRFATNTTTSLSNMSQVQFNEGVGNLKTYFKILGIFIIIGIALVFLIVLFVGLGRGFR